MGKVPIHGLRLRDSRDSWDSETPETPRLRDSETPETPRLPKLWDSQEVLHFKTPILFSLFLVPVEWMNVCVWAQLMLSFRAEVKWKWKLLIVMLVVAGVSGKGFLAPGKGKGNWKSHSRFTGRERELENATGREGNGKFEARNPGNPGKSRESYKKQG